MPATLSLVLSRAKMTVSVELLHVCLSHLHIDHENRQEEMSGCMEVLVYITNFTCLEGLIKNPLV